MALTLDGAEPPARISLNRRLLLAGAPLGLAACSVPSRLPAVPEAQRGSAVIPGMPGARFYVDEADPEIVRWILATQAAEAGRPGPLANILAVSGGAEDGAFGAGILTAWTRRGDRPLFRVVTGVSTGALAAPLAFLGPSRDKQLEEVYTTLPQTSIFERRSFTAALLNDALLDSAPLRRTIAHFFDGEMLREIAAAYDAGRLLLVGTTDLDARRAVIWNIGAIARSRAPGALDLARQVLLASASVPAGFPPVMINVEVNGRRYQEMHVDGGVVSQLFLFPYRTAAAARAAGAAARASRIWVIYNGRLRPEGKPTERRTVSIASTAIGTMIATTRYSDVLRIWLRAERAGLDFNLARIGSDFDVPFGGPFDLTYMRGLFHYGERQIMEGKAWLKAPPGEEPVSAQSSGHNQAARAAPASWGRQD